MIQSSAWPGQGSRRPATEENRICIQRPARRMTIAENHHGEGSSTTGSLTKFAHGPNAEFDNAIRIVRHIRQHALLFVAALGNQVTLSKLFPSQASGRARPIVPRSIEPHA